MLKIILFTLMGAVLNRWRGLGHPLKQYTPKPIPQAIMALPYAILSGLFAYEASSLGIYDDLFPVIVAWVVGIIVLVLTTLGFITGYGQYFPDMHTQPLDKPQFVDGLVSVFFGRDPRDFGNLKPDRLTAVLSIINYGRTKLYWRCAFGMALTGLCCTIPAGIAMMNPWIALSCILKAPAYMISYALELKKAEGDYNGAEYVTGAVLWGSLAVATWL